MFSRSDGARGAAAGLFSIVCNFIGVLRLSFRFVLHSVSSSTHASRRGSDGALGAAAIQFSAAAMGLRGPPLGDHQF